MQRKALRIVFAAVMAAAVLVLGAQGAPAQSFPQSGYFHEFFQKAQIAPRIVTPAGLDDFVTGDKLRLSLEDAIKLTLGNNTDLRISAIQVDNAAFALLKSQSPFDPLLTTSFIPARNTLPSTTELAGAATLSSLTQTYQSQYSQLFGTGTLYQVTFGATKSASNSSFDTLNPAIASGLTVSLTQPLLRNRGWYLTHAPILVASRNLKQSRENFGASVNDAILKAVNDYWDVVQAERNLGVLQGSLKLAEASYQHDKRALELGAISQLDIYRSEAQVAQVKLQIVQSQLTLRQAEDELRRTIGADLSPRVARLELDLTEPAETPSEMRVVELGPALEKAYQARPELHAVQIDLDNAQTQARVAQNELKPDLSLGGFYTMNGIGGNTIDSSTGAPIVTSSGGLLDSFSQLSSMNFPSYGMSLTLRLPLRNRSAEADVGNAIASERRSLYTQRQRQQAIGQELKNAINQLEQAKLSIAAAKVNRDLSAKNLEAEQRKYELGVDTIFFVLDAQNQLSQAEQSLLGAEISYQRSLAAVDHATGELLEKHQVMLEKP